MEKLLAFLESVHPLSPELREQLPNVVQRKQYRKKEHLLRPGEICRNMYYIEEGLIRCYYLKDGIEITSFFMDANDICVEVTSFYDQISSTKFLQALEDTTVYYIDFDQLEAIFDASMGFNIIGRKLTVKYLKLWDKKLDNILMSTTRERYEGLQKQFPNLEQRIADKYIASYLGMIPESLSRMKSQLYRAKTNR